MRGVLGQLGTAVYYWKLLEPVTVEQGTQYHVFLQQCTQQHAIMAVCLLPYRPQHTIRSSVT